MATTREELARRTRRLLIDVARRRQKPGSGSVLELTDWSDMTQWPDLTGLLKGLRWAIAGAVATRLYMPERATRDVDVAVFAPDIGNAETRLADAGYVKTGKRSIGAFTSNCGQLRLTRLDRTSIQTGRLSSHCRTSC